MANNENLKPFQKGDKRINRKGKPKSFTALRELAQQIAHKDLPQRDGSAITVTEAILTAWASSKDPRLQMQFIEVAYGKVPATVELSNKDGEALEINVSESLRSRVDSVAARLRAGSSTKGNSTDQGG